MPAPKIQSFSRVIPMIYAYNTPGISYHEGWTKIGYTEKQSVQQRIGQQTHTADIQWTLAWMDNAMFKDGSGQYFTDHDFHDYLQTRRQVERTAGTEWFHVDGPTSQRMFMDFTTHQQPQAQEQAEYTLREEQAQAVAQTKAYFEQGGREFLWNAKPRFGKTLTAYDLIRAMRLRKVLIVTNRPSIANSWADDFQKFIAWRGEYDFVSETDALKNHPVVMSRTEHLKHSLQMETQGKADPGMVAFESLQGLKGSKYFDGEYDKLKWIHDNEFDLLVVDESQEGVDTLRTERAFHYIKRKHTLYLSGTPFKQLASEQFSAEQIFNWSYADEQEKKDDWTGDDYNPYEALPRLSMFTYHLSPMIYDTVQKGLDLPGEDETVDFAFDLNEFFLTNESGKFIHEAEIRKFLHALTTQEKYPFSTPELRQELRHTMWYLNRVASAKALYKLLQENEFKPIFGDYEIILAAGDGRLGEDDDKQAAAALDRVREAIRTHDKTITLTVGQLTVGITVPEWSGVLMLCNMKSPSSYMQAAFRAQNPCIFTDENGQRFRKQNAYVFDFDPARTLIIFDEFANNLRPETAAGRGTGDDREENIKRLLNFFPVLGEDSKGKMVELDPKAVLSIPRRLKSQEVVRRGFMSNFLFQNISNIFGAPGIVREIVEKLTPAHEEPKRRENGLDGIDSVRLDDQGEVEIPKERVIGKAAELFGTKIYEDMGQAVQPALDALRGGDKQDVTSQVQNVIETVKQNLHEQVFTPIADMGEIKKGALARMERQTFQDVDHTLEKARDDYLHEVTMAEAELNQKRQEAETEAEVQRAEFDYHSKMQDALQAFTTDMQNIVEKTIQEKPQEVVEQIERHKEEEKKRTVEDTIRDHLRGFSRTIPSFIMAYGDGKLTLANFDDYTEDDVFLEVTGITEDQFRFLRDGGDALNPETGEMEHFAGHLFDEVVFDDSIEEFWNKKQQLADYFDENHDEDIFDYIPPQKTNQIFTPRWVVKKMVDELEVNNPGCFDDPDKTFADLYMKSGLYITEIVKRLFQSQRMKELFPDDHDRIRHIMTKQVYGMAPTRIIYLIATNYILGFDDSLKLETKNFVQADAAEAAKNGTLGELVDRYFG